MAGNLPSHIKLHLLENEPLIIIIIFLGWGQGGGGGNQMHKIILRLFMLYSFQFFRWFSMVVKFGGRGFTRFTAEVRFAFLS